LEPEGPEPFTISTSGWRQQVQVFGGRVGISVPTEMSATTRVLASDQYVRVELELKYSQRDQRYKLRSVSISVATPPPKTIADQLNGFNDQFELELTAATVRAVRLGDLVARAVRQVTGLTQVTGDRRHPRSFPMGTEGPHEQVAGLWLIARVSGHTNPNVFIAEELGITPQAAAQRVARARKLELIPPAAKPGAPSETRSAPLK